MCFFKSFGKESTHYENVNGKFGLGLKEELVLIDKQAIVIGPNVMKSNSDMNDTPTICNLIVLFIEHYTLLFAVSCKCRCLQLRE